MNNAHIISIGSLASFSRGLTYSRSDEVDYSSNVVLRSNNIDLATNTLNFDELKYISDAINIPEDKKLQRNSIFMCMSNGSKQHLGKVAFIDRDYPYAFGGFMGLIKPKEDIIIPKLLYYYFCSSKFKGFLSSIGNGANINNIKFVDIAKDYISVPEKTTQQSIIEELDKINELIRLKKEQLKDYDNLAQSIFYEMFGDPVVNEKGWEVKKLGEVAMIKTGPFGSMLHKEDYITGGIPLINPMHIQNFKAVPDKYFTISKEKAAELCDYQLKINDVIFARRGDIGRCAVISDKEAGYLCGTGSLFVRFERKLSSIYTMYVVRTTSFIKELVSKAKGATMLNLNSSTMENLRFPIPPLPLQQAFAQRIELIEQQKAEIQNTIADLETLLASRMQYWFD